MLESMPKRTSLGRLSRRSLAKGKCKIETAISELSLATVCSSADLSDFMDKSVAEDSPAASSSFISDCLLPKQGSCMSCCPSCCYPLLEASIESSSTSHNAAKAVVSHSPASLDLPSNSNCGKNCIPQRQDSVPQHILLEYVKGLQDANKSRDADTAERLLQELGECLNSLSSASTVVSAGGARAIASTLKLFRYHSLQKPSIDTSEDAKSGISKIKSDAGIANSISGGERKPAPLDSPAETPCNSNKCVQLKDNSFLIRNTEVIPIPGSVASEVGRKRQRTVEGLDEEDLSEGEEMISDTSDCDLCLSTETFLSSSAELSKVMDTVQESAWAMCAGVSGEGCLKIAEQGGASQDDITVTSTLDARCTSNSEPSAMIKLDSNKAGVVAELQSSSSIELASGGNPVLGHRQSDLSVHGSLVSGADGSKLVMENPEASLSSKKFATDAFGAPCPTATMNRKTQEQVSVSNAQLTEVSQGDSCHTGGSRENRERQKYCEENEHQHETEGNCLTKLSFDGTIFKDTTRKHYRGDQKRINADEKVTQGPNVLSLSKDAGLTNVVSAGCFVLERLLNVVLQGKGCSRTRSSIIAGSERRGKSLRAEMYVALTEAFVEILQPLQDIFSMLMWCLDCLAHILPPCTSETCMGYSSVQNAVASCLNKELRKPLTEGEEYKVQTASKSGTHSIPKDQGMVAPKSRILSFSDAVNNGTCKSQAGGTSLSNQPYNEIGAESAASSISALAAVAYSATVPMLAEKAVKGILQVLHPRNIDSESTIAALRALSAHLSSVTSKSLCDDAFAFIIAAMKEFLSSSEVQIQGFTAIGSLVRALNSTMGHTAWVAVTVSMEHHRTDLLVQRAGCSTLQMLCAKTTIGHSEWSNGKRPLRASKDSDREGGARSLISAMSIFPQDVRIQWYACSTMWNLVHCAGIKSVLAMVSYGAVVAVVGAMAVCRTNEVVQHEGCNVLGTMAKTLAENGFKFDHKSRPTSVVDAAVNEIAGRCGTVNCQNVYKDNKKVSVQHNEMKGSATVDDWWAALWAVVGAMKAFKNSESVQSYGTYALGCMLKVFTEAVPSGSSFDLLSSSDFLCNSGDTKSLFDSKAAESGQRTAKKDFSVQCGADMAFSSNVLDGIGELHTVVEIVMVAMREFPKIETIQIWGCAVLQQAFPAYIQLAQRMFLCSNDREDSVLDVGHDSKNASLCFLQPQVRDLFENEQKAKSVVLGTSAIDHTHVFLKESCRKASSKFNSTEKESLMASISKCNGELPCGAVVGKSIDSHADNTCSQCTAEESCQLESSESSHRIHMSSFSCQEKALVSKIEETMHPRQQHFHAFIDIVLSQATSAISLISEAIALDINDTQANDDTCSTVSDQHSKASPRLFGNKFTNVKFQCGGGSTKSVVSIRHSWFAALGVLGDVFCDLAKHLESFAGCGLADRSILKDDIGQPWKASDNSFKMLNKHLDLRSRFISKGDSHTHEEMHDKPWWEALSSEKHCTGLPLLLKTAIMAVLSALSKIEDVDTVIWSLQALPNLYTAWGTVCIGISGVENHQEIKKTLWGDGDVGVKKLVDLLSHWTEQNRLDVMIFALHAIYCASNSIATVCEIEDVFGLSQCGMQAVLGALQKALSPSVSIQQRRKLIQLSCYVLSAICSYSVRSQFSFAISGGADLVIAALVRYGDDEQTYASGLQALGIDPQSKTNFSKLLNAAVSRNMTASSGKSGRRKKTGSTAGNGTIGLKHVFKESTVIGSSSASKLPSKSDFKDGNESGRYKKEKWTPQLEKLFSNGKEQMGVLQTLLIASPGCGGLLFAVELLKSLNEESQRGIIAAEAQAHVCIVISYMADSDSNWRKELINEGAIEAVLLTMGFAFGWRDEEIYSFHMIRDGVEIYMEPGLEIKKKASEALSIDRGNQVSSDCSGEAMISEKKVLLDASVQCAACWALANLAKDHGSCFSTESLNMIQAVAAALRRYGGLTHRTSGSTTVLSHTEVCIPARLVLARLGVTRIDNQLLSHKALEAGDIMCLGALVSKGVDISVPDDSGRTALWYAEKSGHTHILHYLRTYGHSHGRKRARGKTISKCKHGNQQERQHENINSSVNQDIGNAQLEEIENLQNEHILNSASCISNVSTKNSEQSELKTEASHEKSESRKHLPEALGIESICDENLVKSEVDTEVQEIAMKKTINILKKQKNCKKNKKVHMNHREESDDKAIFEKQSLDAMEGHARGQVNDVMTVEEYPSLDSEMDAKQLNLMLREAMASGNIEKLEAALRTCTPLACNADKDLVKKVKAALQKRLRRMEKCVALDNELCSAMKEGNKSQLNAAIAEIESVPRFAAALQEKLNAARQELNNVEMRERMMVTDIQIASECSSEMDELQSVTKQSNLGATDKILHSVVMQGEGREFGKNMVCIVDVESKTKNALTEVSTSIEQNMCFKNAVSDEGTINKVVQAGSERSLHEEVNNIFMNGKMPSKLGNIQSVVPQHSSNLKTESEGEFQRTPVSQCQMISFEQVQSVQNASLEATPLLGTLHVSRSHGTCQSVIKPPHPKNPLTMESTEHYPITSQLFPASGGDPLGYGSHVKQRDVWNRDTYFDNLRSFNGSFADTSEFVSSPNSHADTYFDYFQQEPQVGDFDEPGHSPFSPTASVVGVAMCVPSLFHQTMENQSLGSSDNVPDELSSPLDSFLHYWNPPNMKSESYSFLFPAEPIRSINHPCPETDSERYISDNFKCNNHHISRGPFSQHTDQSWFHFQDQLQNSCGANTAGLYSFSRVVAPPPAEPLTEPACDRLAKMLHRVTLNDAYIGETCSICEQTTKDAALVPCGHCMCKVCADNVQLINCHCPVCNRFISAIHSLS